MPSPPDADFEGRIRLPAHCLTVEADDLRVRLVLAADRADTIVVDASEVESVGQAVLQLLVAAKAEAERNGGRLAIEAPIPAVRERLFQCGLLAATPLAHEGADG